MPRRDSDDRCPGVLRPFSAADGAIVRLRAPGGRVPTATLLAVTRLARDFGQPFVQVTSRGNLQLRGLAEPVPDAFIQAVDALGLLPSATHERVRNIVAEPAAELDDLVGRLDDEIRADDRLTALSGRWVFALAVTTDWLDRMPYDVAFHRITATTGALAIGTHRFTCTVDDAPRRLVEIASLFTEIASPEGAWNISDLALDHAFFRALAELPRSGVTPLADSDAGEGATHTPQRSPTPQRSSDDGGVASATVLHLPLGLLDEGLAAALVHEAEDVVVTPERSIVLRAWRPAVTGSEAKRRLVAAGFVTDESSASTLYSACIGAPWCRRTTTSTLELTRAAVECVDHSEKVETARTHVVGCERACGRPATAHRLVVAPPDVSAILQACAPLPNAPSLPATPAAPTRG